MKVNRQDPHLYLFMLNAKAKNILRYLQYRSSTGAAAKVSFPKSLTGYLGHFSSKKIISSVLSETGSFCQFQEFCSVYLGCFMTRYVILGPESIHGV